MVSLKKNIIANFAGSAWSAIMGLAFVPLYIKLMGVEAYGLIGLMVSIQSIVGLLDLGLSQSLNREMARLASQQDSRCEMRDTARTLECVYWVMALVVFIGLTLCSNFLANDWLKPENISRSELLEALWIMAALIAVRWPIAMYAGGVNGLQKQVALNVLTTVFVTLQGVGAVLVLLFISPTIHTFFIWQILVVLVQVVVMRTSFMRLLPDSSNKRFQKAILVRLWRFAAGMSGITLTAILLMQSDKLILSNFLSLKEFGYYTFAATVATLIGRITGPIFTAYYPRLTSLVATDNQAELIKTYHRGCQLLAVAVLPVALIGATFSTEILQVWVVNDPQLVARTAQLLSLLIIGNMLNGLMTFPYLLQLAHGWTSLTFYTNLVLTVIALPAYYIAVNHWGSEGAAMVWVAINASYLLVTLTLMHRKLLPSEKWNWYKNDVGKIFLFVILVVGCGKFLMPHEMTTLLMVLNISLTTLFAFIAAGMSSDYLRAIVVNRYCKSN